MLCESKREDQLERDREKVHSNPKESRLTASNAAGNVFIDAVQRLVVRSWLGHG